MTQPAARRLPAPRTRMPSIAGSIRPGAAAGFLVLVCLVAACASGPQRSVFQGLSVMTAAAEAAMNDAGALYRAHFIGEKEKADVLKAYGTYQKAKLGADFALKAFIDASGQPDAAAIARITKDASDALSSLLGLVSRLKQKTGVTP